MLEPVGDVPTWVCIHNHEAAWDDDDPPFWGGLQFDEDFQHTYGQDMIDKYGGYANLWSERDQMVVAYRGWLDRGYEPWPNTRKPCGV